MPLGTEVRVGQVLRGVQASTRVSERLLPHHAVPAARRRGGDEQRPDQLDGRRPQRGGPGVGRQPRRRRRTSRTRWSRTRSCSGLPRSRGAALPDDVRGQGQTARTGSGTPASRRCPAHENSYGAVRSLSISCRGRHERTRRRTGGTGRRRAVWTASATTGGLSIRRCRGVRTSRKPDASVVKRFAGAEVPQVHPRVHAGVGPEVLDAAGHRGLVEGRAEGVDAVLGRDGRRCRAVASASPGGGTCDSRAPRLACGQRGRAAEHAEPSSS